MGLRDPFGTNRKPGFNKGDKESKGRFKKAPKTKPTAPTSNPVSKFDSNADSSDIVQIPKIKRVELTSTSENQPFQTRWKSKKDIILTMESMDGENPTLSISGDGIKTVEIPTQYLEAFLEFSGYNPISSHKISYMRNFSSPRKYGAVVDETTSDGYYVIPGQSNMDDGTPFLQWSDRSENRENPDWSLTISGLFWKSIAKAKWDDPNGVKTLVELMKNPKELYAQAALLYPSEMSTITAKMQHLKELAEFKINSSPGDRISGPAINSKLRRSIPNAPKDSIDIDKFYYEKTSDGIRLIALYIGGVEESYGYDELSSKLKENSYSSNNLYRLLDDTYKVLESLDPVKFAKDAEDELEETEEE